LACALVKTATFIYRWWHNLTSVVKN